MKIIRIDLACPGSADRTVEIYGDVVMVYIFWGNRHEEL